MTDKTTELANKLRDCGGDPYTQRKFAIPLHAAAQALNDLEAERDALREAIQEAHKHARGVLSQLDSYSWHQHDASFVASTRTSAYAAFERLSRAIDTKEESNG